MNPVAMILSALKTWPEPPTPELYGKEPLELAEAHSRLAEIGAVVRELQKLVGQDLADKLAGKSIRYGSTIFRGVNGRGSAKIINEEAWWDDVVEGLKQSPNPSGLLAALYPASSVRTTALPKLAAALAVDELKLKWKHVGYADSPAPLQVMPISRAPQYLQKLEDGEIK